jgi:hypothetical protein
MEDFKSLAAGEKPEPKAKAEERAVESYQIEAVILLTNGTLVVLDEDGGRIQELEGDLAAVVHGVLSHSGQGTKYFFGSFDPPGLWPSTRAAFKRMAKAGQ